MLHDTLNYHSRSCDAFILGISQLRKYNLTYCCLRARLGRGRLDRTSSRLESLPLTSRRRNVSQRAKPPPQPSTSKENNDFVKTENVAGNEKIAPSVLIDINENNGIETDNDTDQEPDHESDLEDMDDGEDGDQLSEVSESFSSSSQHRSRIPVPIAGSYGKHLVSIDVLVMNAILKNDYLFI